MTISKQIIIYYLNYIKYNKYAFSNWEQGTEH